MQKKSKPAPIPFPPLGDWVRFTVITKSYAFEMEITVNDKTRKAESGVFNLDTLNGATIKCKSQQ